MRILFMGTPEFAVASLRRLVEDGHEICGVFTQPDKPKNRGHKLMQPPVKEYALTKGLAVYQPLQVRDADTLELVQSLSPDLIVVAAYGKVLPEEILDTPQYGSINVHSSLLPKYRGAAPINWAILNGETETGVSIMYMAKELDAGDIILQKTTAIRETENAQELTERLAELGATYAAMLSREMSTIDWNRSAHEISCQVRGLIPWPCASTDVIHGEMMKLYAVLEAGEATDAAPGEIVAAGKQGIEIACGDGKRLRILELQAQGGKRMSAAAYLLGHPIQC